MACKLLHSRTLGLIITRSVYRGTASARPFSTTHKKNAKNRIYTPARTPEDFQSYLLLSTSSRTPLITFWSASYCNTCQTVSPILNELISTGVGEEEGGVTYCEIEYDSNDIMNSGLGMTYMITKMPTILSFDRGEAQTWAKITDPTKMADREWLKDWIRIQAKGVRSNGGRGDINTGLFGGLFGDRR